MDNPETRAIVYYAFGMFYLLCIAGTLYAMAYYTTH